METDFMNYAMALLALEIVLTVWVFREQLFERGYPNGQAAKPKQVQSESSPDPWRRSR